MTLFICPAKKYFFAWLQIFLNTGWDFLNPKELASNAKKKSVVIVVYKFGQEFFIIGIFWKFLYKYIRTILAKTP